MPAIETDYLVIGAGASGMAFADELLTHTDADIVLVDRRHRPGGHWNDAYPFIRLHQPSAFYGVNSRPLGNDRIDETGPNAGYYERATAAEILDYYQRVLEEQMLPSGRVRFFGLSDYLGNDNGEHRFVSRVTGDETAVRVRRRLVDAAYLESSVPSTHSRAFDVEPGARVIPPNDLVNIDEPATGYTVIGAGKTAMDSCSWLLEQGVDPDRIRWLKPSDSWVWDRGYLQPRDLVVSVVEGTAVELESAAMASDTDDWFRRLEEGHHFFRLDPDVWPTIFRGAILSEAERQGLRQVENVVRQGRVRHIGTSEIRLDKGSIPTDAGQLHIDCTAAGLSPAPPRTMFEADRITPQSVIGGLVPFSAAVVGFIETTDRDDGEKNRLCPPNPYPSAVIDWLPNSYRRRLGQAAWGAEPDIAAWLEGSRLNVSAGIRDRLDDPRMLQALGRVTEYTEPARKNMERLLREAGMAEVIAS